MEELDNMDDGSSPVSARQTDSQESEKLPAKSCVQSLVHACQCTDTNCRLPNCQEMKRNITYTKCHKKADDDCPAALYTLKQSYKSASNCVREGTSALPKADHGICKQLISICHHHAGQCQEPECLVIFCSKIKHKLKEQQLQKRLQQTQLLRKKIRAPERTTTRPIIRLNPGTQAQPTDVHQVVDQAQEEGARQKALYASYGEVAPSYGTGEVGQPSGVISPPEMQTPFAGQMTSAASSHLMPMEQ